MLVDNQRMMLSSPGRGVDNTSRGTLIRTSGRGSVGGDKPKLWAFGVTCSANTFTIQAGVVNIFGSKKFEVNGGTTETPTSYQYTAATEYVWICVRIYLNLTTSPAILGLSAYPTPTNSEIYWPLVRYRSDDSGVTYVKDGKAYILHRGDINLIGPIIWS